MKTENCPVCGQTMEKKRYKNGTVRYKCDGSDSFTQKHIVIAWVKEEKRA